MKQIVAIMKQSKNCEQLIKYECCDSSFLGSGYGWWVSRQGLKMNYWGGAAVDRGIFLYLLSFALSFNLTVLLCFRWVFVIFSVRLKPYTASYGLVLIVE